MTPFIIERNNYLTQNIQAFYHIDYMGMRQPGNPDYLNDLKNTFNNFSQQKLHNAITQLEKVLLNDLPEI